MWGVLQMNFMKSPKIILFDLDGVILDTESIYLNLMIEYNEMVNLPITKDFYIHNFLGKTKKEINEFYKKEFKEKFDSDKYWNGIIKYRDDYILHNEIKIKEEFLNLKKYLKVNNYLFGIVTSNSKELTTKLLKKTRLPINDFEFIITRDDVLHTKPEPDLYLKAIDYYKNRDNFIAIEDSNVGIESALKANIKVINLKDIDIIKPDLKLKCLKCVESLNEVIDILEEMRKYEYY